MSSHVAIDLGAGSGRAVLGRVDADRLEIEEVHRFHYEPRQAAGRLRWDAGRLFEGIRAAMAGAGAAACARGSDVVSVGVDGWGVDYGLLDADGRLLEEPVCYRDARTAAMMDDVFRRVPREELFRRTGLQSMQLNTLFQLAAHAREPLSARAARLLMIPDLAHHLLCGAAVSERSDASTTQLLNATTGRWDDELFARLALPRHLMPPLVETGTELGALRDDLAAQPGLSGVRVMAPATHDTACAVAATPLRPGAAFISSGTWSLVGVERRAPLLDAAVCAADFTNESGAFGRVCFLKNVTGLWLLDSCRREWAAQGSATHLPALLAGAARLSRFPGFVVPDHSRFFNPASMTRELQAALTESGQPPTGDHAELTRVILDSLALRYASVVEWIERLTGEAVLRIHVVGGGSLNRYLNQATANATGRTVEAGPVEATAIGNLLIQAVATGTLASLEEGRALLRRTVRTDVFEPQDAPAWREARARYGEIEKREM